jgi:glycosyltransferase involved in cell wall biosynthesis
MKILLLTESDLNYGGYIVVYRLFLGLKKHGVNVSLGVLEKTTDNDSVLILSKKINSNKSHILTKFFRLFDKIGKLLKNKTFITSNPIGYTEAKKTNVDINKINNSDYDLVHLHWIYRDVISIEDLRKIKKPIVITLHDSWIFCGAEYHPNVLENDMRFIEGYTKKNKPKTTKGRDVCRYTWERKIKAWKNIHINFISPSNFEKESLQKSFLFRNAQCTVIPNIVPSEVFRKLDKNMIREMYGIPKNKIIIGFGAAAIIARKSFKGEYLLLEALQKISNKNDFLILLFGKVDPAFIHKLGFPVFDSGAITNSFILTSIYNACDIFVCPSIIENLPTVCIEAQFCGLPVVAFQTGGIPDIVKHKETGYLAVPFDSSDLYEGIIYCIDNAERLSQNSIVRMNNVFDNEYIVDQHIKFYESVINNI